MVRVYGVHRTRIDVATVGPPIPPPGGGGGGPTERPEVEWMTTASSVAENATNGVRATAGVSETVQVDSSVPFVVTGTATRGIDYDLRNGPTASSALITSDKLNFPAGSTAASVYIVPRTDAIVEGTETVILRLANANGSSLITGLQLGDLLTHTCSVLDTTTGGGGPVISFAADNSSVQEGTASANGVNVAVGISPAATGATTVAYTLAGTAQLGVHYTITAGTSPLGFATGTSSNQIRIQTIPNSVVGGNRTIEITLGAITGSATLGAITTHTVTIIEDDVATGPPVVNWLVGSGQVTEGYSVANGLLLIPVTLAQSTPHPGVTVNVVVEFGTTAIAGEDYVLLDEQVVFPPGITSANVRVEIPENATNIIPPSVTLRLRLAAIGTTSTIGNIPLYTLSIFDNDGPVPMDDGPLLDYLGQPLCDEREQFDENAPHILMYPHLIRVTPLGVAVSAAGTQPITQTDWPVPLEAPNGTDAVSRALRLAAQVWLGLNGAPNPRVGEEGNSVLIKCYNELDPNQGPHQGPQEYIGRRYNSQIGTSGANNLGNIPEVKAAWAFLVEPDTGRTCVRDVIFYSAYPYGSAYHYCNWIITVVDPSQYMLDNIRFERIRFGTYESGFQQTNFIAFIQGSAGGVNPTPAQQYYTGVIKWYDCTFSPYPEAIGSWGPLGRKTDWGARIDHRMVCDVRHRFNTFYPVADDYSQHFFYMNQPTSGDRFPMLANRPNVFANLYPGQTVGDRTFIQSASRSYLPEAAGDPPTSDFAFIRCRSINYNASSGGGAQAFTVFGTRGRVYVLDCVVANGSEPFSRQGGIGCLAESGWRGCYVFDGQTEGCTEDVYVTGELVIDGFRYSTQVIADDGRSGIISNGTEIIRLIKYDFTGSNVLELFRFGVPTFQDDLVGGTNGLQYPAGTAFTHTLDVSNLRYPDQFAPGGVLNVPYTGPLSQYPGNGTPFRYFGDGYHCNWNMRKDNYHEVTATPANAAVFDALPAIIAEQALNRLSPETGGSGDGLGTISHAAWPFSDTPLPPDFIWGKVQVSAGGFNGFLPFTTQYVGENETYVKVSAGHRACGSMVPIRATWAVNLGATTLPDNNYVFNSIPNTVVIQGPQDIAAGGLFPRWRNGMRPPFTGAPDAFTGVGPYSFDSIPSTTEPPFTWIEPLYPDGIVVDLSPVGVLTTGTKTLRLDLTVEWQYPRGGAYTPLVSSEPVHRILVVPVLDWPLVSFDVPEIVLPASSTHGGLGIVIAMTRVVGNGANDGLQLVSEIDVGHGPVVNTSGNTPTLGFAIERVYITPSDNTILGTFITITTNPTPGDQVALVLPNVPNLVQIPKLKNCKSNTSASANQQCVIRFT